MKINKLSRFVAAAGLALAIGGVVLLPGTVSGQAVSTPEKGATKLMKIETADDLQKIDVGDTVIMSCPKCKDTFATVVDRSTKGRIEEKATVLHLCPTCETKIVFTGQGRRGPDKLVHTCKNCGSTDVSCCVLKKNGGATSGMEQPSTEEKKP